MTEYTNAIYMNPAEDMISVDINGDASNVAANIDNAHYADMIEQGTPIAPWTEPSLVEVQQQARFELGEYYTAYSHSQFVAGSDTFSAQDPTAFLVISEVLRVDPTNTSQVVFDILGDPHPVANPAAWANFWDQYVALFDTARGIVGQAWQDVKAAPDADGVKTVMDALPPIPGS